MSVCQDFPGNPPVAVRRIIALAAVAALLWPFEPRSAAQERPPSPSPASPPADALARPTSPTPEQIDGWIDSLRHDVYAIRQAAARQLLAAGSAARAPLTAAADSPDPEARAAARRLVTLIDKAECERRLAAFAADTDGREGLTLPGWEQYRKLVGGDAPARALFVEMQRHEATLLADVFDADRLPQKQLWEDRLMRLLRWPATPAGQPAAPSLGTCATMIFLGSVDEGKISDQTATYLPQLMQRPPVQLALLRASGQDPLRRLAVAWVVECPNRSAIAIAQRLSLAQVLDMQEAVPFALGVAQSDPTFVTVHPMVRAQALILVAQLGNRSDAERLEPLLEDPTVCRSMVAAAQPGQAGPVAREVQIRDLALVAMLQLTDQDPADYGYRHARRQSQQRLDPGSVFPESDDERATAVAKWREWKLRQTREAAAQEQVN